MSESSASIRAWAAKCRIILGDTSPRERCDGVHGRRALRARAFVLAIARTGALRRDEHAEVISLVRGLHRWHATRQKLHGVHAAETRFASCSRVLYTPRPRTLSLRLRLSAPHRTKTQRRQDQLSQQWLMDNPEMPAPPIGTLPFNAQYAAIAVLLVVVPVYFCRRRGGSSEEDNYEVDETGRRRKIMHGDL